MITLEGYEIEEMRSINHIMTVELQFDRPVTQTEARNYLSRVLARANETEAKAMKEFCEKNNTGEAVISKDESLEIADDNPEIVNEEPKTANDKPKRIKIDWDKACALKLAGWSNSEIAVELHASKGTIDNAIYKHLNEYEQGKREGRREEETEED